LSARVERRVFDQGAEAPLLSSPLQVVLWLDLDRIGFGRHIRRDPDAVPDMGLVRHRGAFPPLAAVLHVDEAVLAESNSDWRFGELDRPLGGHGDSRIDLRTAWARNELELERVIRPLGCLDRPRAVAHAERRRQVIAQSRRWGQIRGERLDLPVTRADQDRDRCQTPKRRL
jgi:hypothetical protein